MSAPLPHRNVHVLFVHGVGRHSRLSSLLQAYQAMRSNLASPEPPITYEDPIPGWRLAGFDDGAPTPYLKLEPVYKSARPGQPTEGVYLYEVNYSALAGVIRGNQPLDITRLFVGFDLAANVAREALRLQPPLPPQPGGFAADHVAIGEEVQKIATVLVAATVPILGLPSLLLREYTRTFVSTFTRFFEDVATFALDKNGERLISAHVDQTVREVTDPARFRGADGEHAADVFVVAAHSLGTVVMHHYLTRHWPAGTSALPGRMITYGSPIGLVCWLWLFLDFPRMKFDPEAATGDNYFCWKPQANAGPLRRLRWINVANHMDPIATAFPLDFVHLDEPIAALQAALEGGGIEQRFIKTGGPFSVASAHTDYFDQREGLLEILGRLIGLMPGDPAGTQPEPRAASEHWSEMAHDLGVLRWTLWGAGTLCIAAYLALVGYAYQAWEPLALLPFYALPPLTIAGLAFFQKLFFGWPTKRTPLEWIRGLRWSDWSAFPYLLRRRIGLSRSDPDPLAAGPNPFLKLLWGVISFLPSALLLLAPPLIAWRMSASGDNPFELAWHNAVVSLILLALFTLHLLFFAASEISRHWRAIIRIIAK